MREINKKVQSLKESMKEHKGPLTSIRVKSNDKECVSASADGTCIIWDLIRFVRNQVNYRIIRFMRYCSHKKYLFPANRSFHLSQLIETSIPDNTVL